MTTSIRRSIARAAFGQQKHLHVSLAETEQAATLVLSIERAGRSPIELQLAAVLIDDLLAGVHLARAAVVERYGPRATSRTPPWGTFERPAPAVAS